MEFEKHWDLKHLPEALVGEGWERMKMRVADGWEGRDLPADWSLGGSVAGDVGEGRLSSRGLLQHTVLDKGKKQNPDLSIARHLLSGNVLAS